MSNNNLICPVGNGWVNSNQVRLNAAIICVSVTISFLLVNPFIIGFLAIDFFMRGFVKKLISLVNFLSGKIINLFAIGYKKENKAPKQFAAKIGFFMSLLAVVLFVFGFTTLFLVVVAVLIAFSFLESAFSFCAGCVVYTFLVKVNFYTTNS